MSPGNRVVSSDRRLAYTTPRPDICAMVPGSARRILDVGCSTGALGRSMKQARSDRAVYGIERDPLLAGEARSVLDGVIEADLSVWNWSAPFDGGQFDCIVFADVLEHLAEPERILTSALPFLSDDGVIVVSVPNIRHVSAIAAITWGGRFPRRDRGIFDSTHLRWFTIADIRALIAACGYRVDAEQFSLRWGDRGGGRWNRVLARLPGAVKSWGFVREFLTYQVCIRAEPVRGGQARR